MAELSPVLSHNCLTGTCQALSLSGVSVMTGVTLVTHCPRADNTRTSAKYRKKDLDTKWILLLENEPVTRLQLLLSSRSLCVFKLSNNLNLLWKDWITGLILLDIMWQYPADFWSDPTCWAWHKDPSVLVHSRMMRAWSRREHLDPGQGEMSGQWRLTWRHVTCHYTLHRSD